MFNDVIVPNEGLLGEVNRGFSQAMEVLAAGRIGVAAMAVGIGRACLEESLAYARKRTAFGHPIGDFEAIQWMLADMATELDAARLLVLRGARLKDAGERFEGSCHGQALCIGDCHAGRCQGSTDPRRPWLYKRLPGRALSARGKAVRDRGGDVGGAEDGDRQGASGSVKTNP